MKRFLLSCAVLLAGVGAARAQGQTGRIVGSVSDQSGGVVPGVTITLASAAGLPPQVGVTGDAGAYRFSGLPIGTYTVTFELAGYRTVVRESIRIEIGFTAQINVQLELATLQETVQVTGASPVVDTQSTASVARLDLESLQGLPVARSFFNMVAMAPGVVNPGKDVGGAQNINQPGMVARGAVPGQTRYLIDGVDVAPAAAANAWWEDFESIEEMQITSGGADASVQTSGMTVNIVTKSGSDAVKGTSHVAVQDQKFQADNLSDRAVREALNNSGTSAGNPLQHFSDWGANIGGPLLKGRLWYWGAFTQQSITLGGDKVYKTSSDCSGVAANPLEHEFGDVRSCLYSIPTKLQFLTYKVGWAPFRNNNFTFENGYGAKVTPNVGLTPLVDITATRDNGTYFPPNVGAFYTFEAPRYWDMGWAPLWKFGDQHVITNSLLVDFAFMHFTKPNVFRLLTPEAINIQSQFEQSTGQTRASAIANQIFQPWNSFKASSSYFAAGKWGGNHLFKYGYEWTRFEQGNTYNAGGQAQALFNSGVLAPYTTPLAANFYRPGVVDAFMHHQSAFLQDTFTLKRLSLNIGLRWDRQDDSERGFDVPASPYQGQLDQNGRAFNFIPAVNFPGAASGVVWNTFAPRLGAVYDISGTAKTVLKANYATYYDMRAAGQLSDTYNTVFGGIAQSFVQFPWNDSNGDKIVQMNEVNTNTIRAFGNNYNPADPFATRSPNSVDPNVRNPRAHEILAGVTQELAAGVAVGASYIYRKYTDFIWSPRNGISAANYSPVTFTPAAGACPTRVSPMTPTQCSAVTYFVPDIPTPTAYTVTNQPDYYRTYHGLELLVRKRMSHHWMLNGSFTYQGNWQYWTSSAGYQDPTNIEQMNGEQYAPGISPGGGFPINIAVNARWVARLAGKYELPWWGLAVSATDDLTQGNPILNSINIATRPNQAGSIAVLISAPGTLRYSNVHTLDLRLDKEITVHKTLKLEPTLEVYNVLNTFTVLAQQPNQNASNANYIGYALSPRIARFSVRVSW